MPINYSSETDKLYAGRVAPPLVPSWVANQPVETWGIVPATNTLDDIDPENDPLINPNHPANAPWHAVGGQTQLTAYSGACYNQDGDELWKPLQGGHQDYAGNEAYKIALNVEVPAWEMIRNPSGAVGNLITLNDGQEATGRYADGRARSPHSYNKPVYIPNVGAVLAVLGSTAWSGQAGTSELVKIDPITGEHTFGAALTGIGNSSGTGACYDPTRHCVWARKVALSKFAKYDVEGDTWTDVGAQTNSTGYYALEYIPEHDCLLVLCTYYTNNFAVFDCKTGVLHEPNVNGSMVGGNELQGKFQPRYYNGGFLLWHNSTDTTVINKISYGADPRTDDWTITQLPVALENNVTPTVAKANGTYGRFFVSTKMGICGVINATNQPIYFYKI